MSSSFLLPSPFSVWDGRLLSEAGKCLVPLPPFPRPCGLHSVFLEIHLSSLRPVLGRQTPTPDTFLWCSLLLFTPNVNCDLPMKSLLQSSGFLPFLSSGKISTSVFPSNKKTRREMEQVNSSSAKMFFSAALSQCPWSLHEALVLTPALGQLYCTFDNELSNLAMLYWAFTGGRKSHIEVTLLFNLKVLKTAVSNNFLPDFFSPQCSSAAQRFSGI